MNAYATGMKFEKMVRKTFVKHGFTVLENTGGSKSRPDVSILYKGIQVNIECKTKNGFEGGAHGLHVDNGRLVSHDSFFANLLNNVNIWDGRIPSFKLGNKDFDVWINEKHLYKDIWVDIDPTCVSHYYARKSIHYIMIEGDGIYTTGHDPLYLGCPLFTCRNRLRIRCKRHSSSSMPSTVQASLVFKKYKHR